MRYRSTATWVSNGQITPSAEFSISSTSEAVANPEYGRK